MFTAHETKRTTFISRKLTKDWEEKTDRESNKYSGYKKIIW